ncbi:MAG: hypothetical protein MJD61_16655, partial [Proteobacteria bacterium]|nr:hypothetical protein [Pseudomonadota bacterium]
MKPGARVVAHGLPSDDGSRSPTLGILVRTACMLVGLAVPAAALANGRYPRAQQVLEDPRDPNHLIVRATYGLLVTRDAGKHWSLICEQAAGYGGNEDPMLGLLGDGSLLAGTLGGLVHASDRACRVERAHGVLGSAEIVDVAVHPVDRTRALALSRSAQPGLSVHRLWQTSDHGASWTKLGGPFGAELNLVATAFDAAPSDPRRIYVSGLVDTPAIAGVLLRSDDGAVRWTVLPVPDTGSRAIPFFTSVALDDPDTLYVRIRAAKADRLLVSSDGGRSWRSVLEGKAVMA